MPVWKAKDLSQNLSKGKLESVYLLFGDEEYLVEDSYQRIKSMALKDALEDFNFDSFVYPSVDLEALGDLMMTLPVMASYRVISLQMAKDWNKKDLTRVAELCAKCPDSCVLILKAAGVDVKKASQTALGKVATVVRFYNPFPNEIPRWIQKFAKAEGLEIEPEASIELYERLGAKLKELKKAVESLKTYLGDRENKIQQEHVQNMFTRSKEDKSFDLAHAIAGRNRQKALEQLKGLSRQGLSSSAILAILFRQFQTLSITKELVAEGQDSYQIARSLKLPPFAVQSYLESARLWSPAQLRVAIQAIGITEKAIRSTKISDTLWIENFIIKVC